MLQLCNFLLILSNPCNLTSIFPQISTNNTNGTFLLQSGTGCNCTCQNIPDFWKSCGMSLPTISPCATSVTRVTDETTIEPRSSSPMPSSGSPDLVTISDHETKSPPDSSNLEKPSTKSDDRIEDDFITQSPVTRPEVHEVTRSPTSHSSSSSSSKQPSTGKSVNNDQSTNHPDDQLFTTMSPSDTLISHTTDPQTLSPGVATSSDVTNRNDDDDEMFNDKRSRKKLTTTTTQPTNTIFEFTTDYPIKKSSTPIYEEEGVIAETREEDEKETSSHAPDHETNEPNFSTTTTRSPITDRTSITPIDSTSIKSTKKPDEDESPDKVDDEKTTGITPSSVISSNSSPAGSTVRETQKSSEQTTTPYHSHSDADEWTTIVPISPTPSSSASPPQDHQTSYASDKNTINDLTTVTTTPKSRGDDSSTSSGSNIELTTEQHDELISTSTTTPSTITVTSTSEVQSSTLAPNETDCNIDDPSRVKTDSAPLKPLEKQSLRRVADRLFTHCLELSKVLLQNDTSNVAFSPIGISLLLLMTRTGSRSPIKDELDRILYIPKNLKEHRSKVIKNIVNSLHSVNNSGSVETYVANKMYLPENVEINPKYKKISQVIFESEPQTINFKNRDSTARQLNQWCMNSTNNKVRVLIDKNSWDDETSILLASAAYFNGNWSEPFDRFFTSSNVFQVNKNTQKHVCTMLQINKFRYGKLPHVNAEFVQLPYQTDEDKPLSMIVLLPLEGKTIDSVIECLPQLKYQNIGEFSSSEVVELALPKFLIRNSVDVIDKTDKLGWNITNYSDEFKCVSSTQAMTISHIVQKTVINVHEGGCKVTQPVTCTEVEQRCGNSSVKFTVNRPFIVLIVNPDMILFSARVNDPSL